MRYLSFTIVVLMIALYVQGQSSPHGKGFHMDCAQCHTSKNWKVNPTGIQFNHDNTDFKLTGQHRSLIAGIVTGLSHLRMEDEIVWIVIPIYTTNPLERIVKNVIHQKTGS